LLPVLAQQRIVGMLWLLDRLEEVLIAILIAVATLIIFVAVVHRYSAGIPLLFPYASRIDMSWPQELAIYLFVWMAKFGAAYGVRTGIHVGVDVFVNMLGSERRHKVILFGLLCGALFTGVVGSLGAKFVYGISQTGQTSNDLEVPMWIVYLAVPLGSFLMCFRFLQVAYAYWRTGELPHHDAGHVQGLDEELPPASAQARP
jgi:C4-dicarboxylate transporter DctQ subunit